MRIDPSLDLVLERIVDVPTDRVWRAWTEPERLMPWFCPLPWRVVECDIDLRPGGIFRTVMRGPEGERRVHVFCYVEIVPGRKLVWTDALEPGFRPSRIESPLPFRFTAIIEMEPHGHGTKYSAVVLHKDEAARAEHDEIGFRDGWGKALDQLVARAKDRRD